MKSIWTLSAGAWCLGMLMAPSAHAATAKPVHVTLHASAAVQADSNGFFSLASIADLTGGDAAGRARLGTVSIGRAPLPDSARSLTLDDIALKLRQAGIDPNHDAVLEGAKQATITLGGSAAPAAHSATSLPSTPSPAKSAAPAAETAAPPAAKPLLVHRGEGVTIILQDDNVTITAHGVARQDGAQGDTIQVHRDGIMTDMTTTVVDTRTVQLEI